MADNLPEWFPKNPYPSDLTTMTDERYKNLVPDELSRTSLAWFLMGRAYEQALFDVLTLLRQNEK